MTPFCSSRSAIEFVPDPVGMSTTIWSPLVPLGNSWRCAHTPTTASEQHEDGEDADDEDEHLAPARQLGSQPSYS